MYLLIIFLPFIGACLTGLFGRYLGSWGSSFLTTSCLIVSLVCSVGGWILLIFFNEPSGFQLDFHFRIVPYSFNTTGNAPGFASNVFVFWTMGFTKKVLARSTFVLSIALIVQIQVCEQGLVKTVGIKPGRRAQYVDNPLHLIRFYQIWSLATAFCLISVFAAGDLNLLIALNDCLLNAKSFNLNSSATLLLLFVIICPKPPFI